MMAPLFFNASIDAGEIHVSDLFNLYRFEDCIYTLCLTGKEIKNYLEMSYANWTNQMHSIDDNLLLLSPMKSNPERMGFTNFIFNFDSAAGIIYEVDVTRPQGEKITIKRMADGRPFSADAEYLVAMTAYRANGGGELLTKGAGLSKEEIKKRLIVPDDLFFSKEVDVDLSDYYGKVEAPLYEACDEDEDPEWDDKPRWVVYPDDTEEEGGAWLEPHVQRGDA